MRTSFKVGDKVELNGETYTVRYSWLEHRKLDTSQRCIRMESESGTIWVGYQSHLFGLLDGTIKPRETFKQIFG